MLAMRAEVLAKAELRLKIGDAANAAWQELIEETRQEDGPQSIGEMRKASWPIFGEIIKYDNRQLAEEIIPIYRRMVQRLMEKMHLAEFSTISYLQELIDFVEIWNRWLAESLPAEIVDRLGHSEENLYPFYGDVALHFAELQMELKEVRRWLPSRKHPTPIKVVPSP